MLSLRLQDEADYRQFRGAGMALNATCAVGSNTDGQTYAP